MGLSAFNRMRRMKAERENQKELAITDEAELTVKEIKVILDKKGIEYEARAKKEYLIELLKRC